jgi:tight adherence protein B
MWPVFLTFGLVLAVIVGAYWLFVVRDETAEYSALRQRMKGARVKPAGPNAASLVIVEQPLSSVAALDRMLRLASVITSPARTLIGQADVSMTVGTLLLLSAVAAAAAFLLVQYLTGSILLGVPVAGIAAAAPPLVLRVIANRRIAAFEEQFPEAIDLMSRALRAGHAFTTALGMVAEEMPDPVGGEFRLAYDRQNFGMPLPEALRSLGTRVPLVDARFFVTAVLTQREVGGNLSEVLENLAHVIRERFKVKRQVRVVTAHARMTAWVLSLMPPVLFVVLTFMNRETMSVMWTHPTGVQMIAVALVLQMLGALAISRLVKVEY